MKKKIPKSVLVVVHDKDLNVLLLERTDRLGSWQSVTGSVEAINENLFKAAKRELREETGIEAPKVNWLDWNFAREFKIFPQWRYKYDEQVEFNTEHIFSVCVDSDTKIILSPREHVRYKWLFWNEAAKNCFSWTNVLAIKELPDRFRLK